MSHESRPRTFRLIVLKGLARRHTRLLANVCLTAYPSYINACRASIVFARWGEHRCDQLPG